MVKICTYIQYVIIFGKIWTIKLKSVKICTVFEIIDGAQINFKSKNEAIAHDQW